MYGAVCEFQRPTGVTHALRGRFGPPGTSTWGVVFVKRSSLELYNVHANESQARLELISVTPLPVQVISAAVLRRPGSADFLWLGFTAMRVAALAWNATVCDWHTLQTVDVGAVLDRFATSRKFTSRDRTHMSSAPGDEHRVLIRGRYSDQSSALIRSESKGRCVAVLASKLETIVVFPARLDDDLAAAGPDPSSVLEQEPLVREADMFVIDLKEEYGVANIQDFLFLDDYFEPTILLLHEPKRTWAGRIAIQSKTAQLLAISLDLRKKAHVKIWEMQNLPSDAHQVVAIPESAGGGVLVFSPNVLLQVRHEACVAGLSFNCFGDAYASEMSSSYSSIMRSKTLMALDAARCCFLDYREPGIALVSLKGGELYFLTVKDRGRRSISMIRAGSTVLASAIVPVNERFFILASRISDSLLIEYRRSTSIKQLNDEQASALHENSSKEDNVMDENTMNIDMSPTIGKSELESAMNGMASPKKNGKKRRRTAEEEAEYEMLYGTKPPAESGSDSDEDDNNEAKPLELVDNDEGTRGVYDDDDELGHVFNPGNKENVNEVSMIDSDVESWALMVKDTLSCYGPAADLAVGRTPDDATGALDIVVAGGYAKNGCIGVVQQSVRPRDITRFALEGFSSCWTLRDPYFSRRELDACRTRNNEIMTRNAEIRVRNAKREAARQRYVEKRLQEYQNSIAEVASGDLCSEVPGTKVEGKLEAEVNQMHNDMRGIEDSEQNPAQKRLKVTEISPIARKSSDGDTDNNTEKPDLQIAAKDSKVNENQKYAEDDGRCHLSDKRTEFELEALQLHPFEMEDPLQTSEVDDTSLHSYLLLSNNTSTVAMSTGEDLEQLSGDAIEFITDSSTVAAGNVLDNAAIVQVHSRGAMLIADARIRNSYPIADASCEISAATIADPYILLLLANGSVLVLKVIPEYVDEADRKVASDSGQPFEGQGELYYDEYGMESGTDNHGHGSRTENLTRDETLRESAVGGVDSGWNKDAATNISGRKDSLDLHRLHFRMDFQLTSSQAGDRVASACIYGGKFAAGVTRLVLGNGYGSEHFVGNGAGPSQVSVTSNGDAGAYSNLEKSESTMKPGMGTGVDGHKSGDSVDEMDEEERMLYGEVSPDDDGFKAVGVHADQSAQNPEDESAESTDRAQAESKMGITLNGSKSTENNMRKGPFCEQELGVNALWTPDAAKSINQTYLLVTVTKDGALEIRSMSDSVYSIVFRCAHFFLGPQVAVDDGCLPGVANPGRCISENVQPGFEANVKTLKAKKKDRITSIVMTEITGSVLVPGLKTPVLVGMQASGFPLIYSLFLAPALPSQGLEQSNLRMRRITAPSIICGVLSSSASKAIPTPIVPFENVGGRGGIFVGGTFPFFIFAERGFPRMHPLRYKASDGDDRDASLGVTAFSELHNVNCPRGFVYVLDGGIICISELPSPAAMNFDSCIPFRKVALRCSPHKVAYHAGSATYGVLASMPTLTSREERLARMLQSLEKHDKRHYQSTVAQAEAETGDDSAGRVPPLYEELHELRIYRPDSWQLIKSFKLEKGEVGLAIGNISVDVYKQQAANSGVHIPSTNKAEDGGESLFAASQKLRPKNMLVVGTGYLNGEDATSRGRLLMFEISRQEVFTEASGEYTAFQLQLIAEKELPGPVSAVAAMEGYVVAGVGPQLGVYKLVEDEIVYLSFAFGQLFCTSIASVKQYIVSADMYKSISFQFFRNRNTSVNFLAKDYSHAMSYATEFLVNGDQLSMVMSDAEGNIQLLDYAHAMVPESRGGKRLLLNGAVNFGSRINKFQRVKFESEGPANTTKSCTAGRHGSLFATLDGGFGAVIPIDEEQFGQLQKLSDVMLKAQDVVRHASVDPVDARAFRPSSASTQTLNQRLIDTRLAMEVLNLGPARVRLVATSVGMSVDELTKLAMYLEKVIKRF